MSMKLFNCIGGNVFKMLNEASDDTILTSVEFANVVKMAIISIMDVDEIYLFSHKDNLANMNDDQPEKQGLFYWYDAKFAMKYQSPVGEKIILLGVNLMYDKPVYYKHKGVNAPIPNLTVGDLKRANPAIFYLGSVEVAFPEKVHLIDLKNIPRKHNHLFDYTDCGFNAEKHTIRELIQLLKTCIDGSGGEDEEPENEPFDPVGGKSIDKRVDLVHV